MKINFDDISDEEFQFDDILNNIHIKPGNILLKNQYITYWCNSQWITFNYNHNYNHNYTIDKIEISDNINGNPYGQFNEIFKKIPNEEIMFSAIESWCWFKYNENLKIK